MPDLLPPFQPWGKIAPLTSAVSEARTGTGVLQMGFSSLAALRMFYFANFKRFNYDAS